MNKLNKKLEFVDFQLNIITSNENGKADQIFLKQKHKEKKIEFSKILLQSNGKIDEIPKSNKKNL